MKKTCDASLQQHKNTERLGAELRLRRRNGALRILPALQSNLEIIGRIYRATVERLKINHAYQPLAGQIIHFINGDAQQFTDAKAYHRFHREELPFQATSGFRFRTITQDPAVRKAVDDIVYDFP